MKGHALIATLFFSTAAATSRVTEKWKFSFHGSFPNRGLQCAPAFTPRGSLLLSAPDGSLVALSTDGKLEWSLSGVGASQCAQFGPDGKIYGGGALGGGWTSPNQVAAVHANGTLAWTYQLGVSPGPELGNLKLASDGTVLFTSNFWKGQLQALAADGAPKWNISLDGVSSLVLPADENATIYASTASFDAAAQVFSLSASPHFASSEVNWKYSLGNCEHTRIVERHEVVYALADSCNDMRCLNGTISALDKKGTRKWVVETELAPQDIIFDSSEVFYATTVDLSHNLYPTASFVYAMDAHSGQVKWKFHENFIVTSPMIRGLDGTLYLGATEINYKWPRRQPAPCSVKALGKDGKLKWSIPTQGYVQNIVVDKGGYLYFDTSYPDLCLGSEKGSATLLAASPEGEVLWGFQPEGDASITATPVFGKDGLMYVIADKTGPPGPTGYSNWTSTIYAIEPPTKSTVAFVV